MLSLVYSLTNLGVLSLAGLALLILVAQRERQQKRLASDPIRAGLRLAGWILVWLGVFGFLLGVTGFFAVIILPAVGVMAVMVRSRVRHAEDQLVFSTVATSIQHEIALVESLRGLGLEMGGETGRRLRVLVRGLAGGMEYREAAYQADLKPSREADLALDLGHRYGHLPQLLRDLSGEHAELDRYTRPYLDRVFGFALSALALTIICVGLMGFMLIKLVPTFQMILDDFGLVATPPFEFAITLANTYVLYAPLMMPLLTVLGAYFFLFTLYYIGWMRRLPWGIRWLHGPLEEARFLTSVASIIEADIPLASALPTVAEAYRHDLMARRLEQLAEEEMTGGVWIDALVRGKIVTKGEAELLRPAALAGNLPWVLRQVALGKMRRNALRLQPFLDTWIPLLIGFLGFHVFLVMSMLIDMLSGLVLNLS